MRINGIGTMWLGASGRDGNECYATLWFTFIFGPLIPIRRARLGLLPHQGAGFSYRELERTSLNGREILSTLLFSWLLVPVCLFAPTVIAIAEVRRAAGIPDSWETPLIVAAIVWMVVAVWKLADWHENRFHPR
jgi:hypothetical protein